MNFLSSFGYFWAKLFSQVGGGGGGWGGARAPSAPPPPCVRACCFYSKVSWQWRLHHYDFQIFTMPQYFFPGYVNISNDLTLLNTWKKPTKSLTICSLHLSPVYMTQTNPCSTGVKNNPGSTWLCSHWQIPKTRVNTNLRQTGLVFRMYVIFPLRRKVWWESAQVRMCKIKTNANLGSTQVE